MNAKSTDTTAAEAAQPQASPSTAPANHDGEHLHPFSLVFLTEACDKTCPHCFNTWDPNMQAGQVQLDCDTALAVLTTAAQRGLRSVGMTGGEPLLHDGAVPLVAALSALGLRTTIFTSGTNLTQHAEALLHAGLDELRISFNEFPYATSELAFERLWRVFAERLAPALPHFRERVVVNAIASRRSLPLVAELCTRLAQEGIRTVKVQPLYVGKQNPWYERLNLHDVASAEWDRHEHAMRTAGAYGQAAYVALFRAFYEHGRRPSRCGAAPMLVIGADGRVHPCLNRFDLSVGAIGEADPDTLITAVTGHRELADAHCFREECLCLFRAQELT